MSGHPHTRGASRVWTQTGANLEARAGVGEARAVLAEETANTVCFEASSERQGPAEVRAEGGNGRGS